MVEDAGKLVLRLALGALLFLHGLDKLQHGIAGIGGLLEGSGLPAVLAPAVYIGEVVAPLMVLAGFYTRVGAALIVVHMLAVIGIAHRHQLDALNASGGWALELQGFYLLTAVAILLLGPGRLAIHRR